MLKKNVTLSFDSKLYEGYRELCKKEGLIVSRQLEKYMESVLKKEK